MYAILYKYTNGKDRLSIESHFVEMIWESLARYWALVEAVVILIGLTVICLLGSAYMAAGVFAGCTLIALLILPSAQKACRRKTEAEVTQVLANSERRNEIKIALDEILS